MVQRYRARFAILEPMRFTGHLDLMRTWERTLRRAGLPLAYSGGYHAHPRIQIGAALPLGCTASAELLDLWLEQELAEGEVGGALQHVLPPGLSLDRLAALPSPRRDLQDEIVAGDYTAIPLEFEFPPRLAKDVTGFLASPSVMRERRGRSYDLRPLVLDLQILPRDHYCSLNLRVRLGENATGRPDEVLACLDLQRFAVRVNRDRLLLRDARAGITPSDG
ncbi:MAG: TIGR03936 family radical SAM-associated protein [Anaerolineales bacterium]|jgi:radical SAM-linked protein